MWLIIRLCNLSYGRFVKQLSSNVDNYICMSLGHFLCCVDLLLFSFSVLFSLVIGLPYLQGSGGRPGFGRGSGGFGAPTSSNLP